MKHHLTHPVLAALLGVVFTAELPAQTSAFTYQGELRENGQPASGSYDLVFSLHDAETGGNQVGSLVTNTAVAVNGGVFTVLLNFNANVFTGDARWLEIGVRTSGSGAEFTTMIPRQEVSWAPYAIHAANSGYAERSSAAGLVGWIQTNNLAPRMITGSLLAVGSVDSSHLASNSVTAASVANGSITIAQLRTSVTPCSSDLVTNPAPARVDLFGGSVAGLGTDRILIGAPGDDPGATGPKFYLGPGAVYLYHAAGGLLATLANPTPENGGSFGYSVAAAGTDKVLVGVPSDGAGAVAAGVAHLLDTQGNLLLTLTNPTPATYDNFGGAVAVVGGDKLLVAASGDGTGAAGAGAAYLYDLLGNLLVTITNPAPAAYDGFGNVGVAVGPDKLLLGAAAKDLGATNAGAAYLYDLQGHLLTTFTNPTPAMNDAFGFSLASVGGGNQVLIGAWGDDSGGVDAGAVYLFDLQGNLQLTVTDPALAQNNHFGKTLSAFGDNHFLVGAEGADLPGVPDAGLVYVFDLAGAPLAVLNAANPDSQDGFGAILGVVGESSVLVGAANTAVGAEPGVGAVHVFGLCRLVDGLVSSGVAPGSISTASLATGAVTATNIAASQVVRSLNGLQDDVTLAAGTNLVLTQTGNTLTLSASGGSGPGGDRWNLNGNAGTIPGTHFVGTTDSQPLELRVSGQRALRLEPGPFERVNVIGGSSANSAAMETEGVTIAGGVENLVEPGANFTAIGGGEGNQMGTNATFATIAGGENNRILSQAASGTISGGAGNTILAGARYATIAGGSDNTAGGNYSFAAGREAQALHDGAFVWADSYEFPFASVATNEFTVRANGGIRLYAGDVGATVNGRYILTLIRANTNQGGATATISGGQINAIGINSHGATIGGGELNAIPENGIGSTIAGGYDNTIQYWAHYATISGGKVNTIQTDSQYGTISGGYSNVIEAAAHHSTISGGGENTIQASARWASIGGGLLNTIQANSSYTTIGGGYLNTIQTNADWATVSGGVGNTIQTNANHATISGGSENTIGTHAGTATIGGGYGNAIQTEAFYATIGGGRENTIQTNALYTTISGGERNRIHTNAAWATIGGGYNNLIQPDARYATIPGGYNNSATDYAFAAGYRAKAIHTGAFVWADSTEADVASTGPNQFLIRASGGVGIGTTSPAHLTHLRGDSPSLMIEDGGAGPAYLRFNRASEPSSTYIALGLNNKLFFKVGGMDRMFIATNGNVGIGNDAPTDRLMVVNAHCDGSSWINASDRNLKENFEVVEGRKILEAVSILPIRRWNYKSDPGTPHVGPVAQDFHAAFAVGSDDTSIATVDADGVALAAIQALNEKVEARSQEAAGRIERLEAENAELRRELAGLKQLILSLTQSRKGGAE